MAEMLAAVRGWRTAWRGQGAEQPARGGAWLAPSAGQPLWALLGRGTVAGRKHGIPLPTTIVYCLPCGPCPN